MKEHQNRPRVLMLTPHIGVGGLERMILSLALALKERGRFDPSVYSYDFDVSGSSGYQNLISDFKANQVPLLVLKKPAGFSFNVVRNLLDLVRRNGIAIVHSHNIGSLIYAGVAKLLSLGKLRVLHTQHSFIHLKEKKRYAFYEKLFARLADKLTVVSEDTGQSYSELGFGKECVTLIENGVVVFKEPVLSREKRSAARHSLLLNLPAGEKTTRLSEVSDAFWLLYMARLHPEKGQDIAVRVWEALSPEIRSKCALVFVGPVSGPEQLDKLQKAIAAAPQKERVHYMGGTKEPELWLKASDLFLFCSEFEGLPLGPLEAVGSGLPSVLSDIPGHAVFRGVTSLFPLDQPGAGARQIEALYQELNADYGAARQKYWDISRPIAARYSISAMTEKYEKLYSELLKAS